MHKIARTCALTAALLISAITIIACTSPAAAPNPTNTHYLRLFQSTNDTYETVLISAGRAFRDGDINEAQLETVRNAGHVTENTLRTTKAALDLYFTSPTAANLSYLDANMANLTSTVTHLLSTWNDIKNVQH